MAESEGNSSQGGRRTWVLLTIPLVWLFIFAGVWLSNTIMRPFGVQVSSGSGNWMDNVTALFASGPVFLLFWLWLRFFEGRKLPAIGLGRFDSKRFTGGLVAGASLVAVVVAAGWALGGYQISGFGAWFDHITPTWLLASVLAVIGTFVQATVTESLFRGWMFSTAARRWGGAGAVALNLLAVALIQGSNALRGTEMMIGAINFILIAWLLSLNVLRDGTIWGVCGFHTAWNLAMGWGLGLNVDTGHLNITPAILSVDTIYEAPGWLNGGVFGPDGSLLMTLVILVLLVARLIGRVRLGGGGSRPADLHGDEIIDH